MKLKIDCVPCLFRQALTTTKKATNSLEIQRKVLMDVANLLPTLMSLPTPTHAGRIVHNLPKKYTKVYDPYKKDKEKHIEIAKKLYCELKKDVEKSSDPLSCAIKIAVAGNVIDFGRGEEFDPLKDVEETLNCEFKVFDYEEFKKCLNNVKVILYLGDNAGETVFDRVLIEELNRLGKKVLYVVKGVPVLNDATYDDAVKSGLNEVCEIINSGCDAPGILLEYCSDSFKELFFSSQLIISKGQGNFEALSEVKAPVFFLFKVKCQPVADETNLPLNSLVFKKSDNFSI